MKPFRVRIRVQNNRLIRLREDIGMSQAAFARAIDVGVGHYNALECLRRSPIGDTGEWTQTALSIAEYHGVAPSFIWPSEALAFKPGAGSFALELSQRDMIPFASDPVRELEARETASLVADSLASLPPRTVKVIKANIIDGKTLDEVGEEIGRSRERARSLIHEGLRKVRKDIARDEWDEECSRVRYMK